MLARHHSRRMLQQDSTSHVRAAPLSTFRCAMCTEEASVRSTKCPKFFNPRGLGRARRKQIASKGLCSPVDPAWRRYCGPIYGTLGESGLIHLSSFNWLSLQRRTFYRSFEQTLNYNKKANLDELSGSIYNPWELSMVSRHKLAIKIKSGKADTQRAVLINEPTNLLSFATMCIVIGQTLDSHKGIASWPLGKPRCSPNKVGKWPRD